MVFVRKESGSLSGSTSSTAFSTDARSGGPRGLPIPSRTPCNCGGTRIRRVSERRRSGSPIATLAVGNNFVTGSDTGVLVHRAQLRGRFEPAVPREVLLPLEVHG